MKIQTVMFQVVVCTVSGLGLVACDIDQTREGQVPDVDVSAESGQLPRYKMVETQEGRMPDVDVDASSGQLPEYEVEGPDVSIGTEKRKVTVPEVDVTTDETEVTVPDVDVDMPE